MSLITVAKTVHITTNPDNFNEIHVIKEVTYTDPISDCSTQFLVRMDLEESEESAKNPDAEPIRWIRCEIYADELSEKERAVLETHIIEHGIPLEFLSDFVSTDEEEIQRIQDALNYP